MPAAALDALNLTESSPASIRPTLKRQKAPVRRSNPRAGRRRSAPEHREADHAGGAAPPGCGCCLRSRPLGLHSHIHMLADVAVGQP